MQKFEIVLKNDRVKIYRRITLLLVVLNVLFLIVFLFSAEINKYAIASLIIIVLYTAITFFLRRYKRQLFSYNSFVFLLLMILWISCNNYWIAGINFILSGLHPLAVGKVAYEISASSVKQQHFPWQNYSWEKFSNVVLKDNILTLDFKNNRISQVEIFGNNTFDENEFNMFARKQLEAAN